MTNGSAEPRDGAGRKASGPRRRGRPRGGATDTRERILKAARESFEAHGYEVATIRQIAGQAGVDPALVHHYFGTKADLFTASVDLPMRPDKVIPHLISGPREQVGERLARYVLEQMEIPAVRKRVVAVFRTALGSRIMLPMFSGFLQREILGRVAAGLDAPDAQLRATLTGSQIAGLLVARYVVEVPAIAEASVEELVRRIGPTLQGYLFGHLD